MNNKKLLNLVNLLGGNDSNEIKINNLDNMMIETDTTEYTSSLLDLFVTDSESSGGDPEKKKKKKKSKLPVEEKPVVIEDSSEKESSGDKFIRLKEITAKAKSDIISANAMKEKEAKKNKVREEKKINEAIEFYNKLIETATDPTIKQSHRDGQEKLKNDLIKLETTLKEELDSIEEIKNKEIADVDKAYNKMTEELESAKKLKTSSEPKTKKKKGKKSKKNSESSEQSAGSEYGISVNSIHRQILQLSKLLH